jgi:hypothetical protein
MMMYGGMEVMLQTFLTLALEGGEWSATRFNTLVTSLPPQEESLVPTGYEARWDPKLVCMQW